jgi:hypothetical protein
MMKQNDKALEDLDKAASPGNKAAQNRLNRIKKNDMSIPDKAINEYQSKHND